MRRVIIALLGVCILSGFWMSDQKGLPAEDLLLYEKALAASPDTGFSGFTLTNTPIRFFDGEADYVKREEGFVRERPVLPVVAATALEVDGINTLLMPTHALMREVLGLLSGEAKTGYTEDYQAAVLWHEAFHVYQLERYPMEMEALARGVQEESGARIDQNEEAKALFEEALPHLHRAAFETDPAIRCKEARRYLALAEMRDAFLTEGERRLESYTETVEGTAYFVEMEAARALGMPMEVYTSLSPAYANGPAKYYNAGMLMYRALREIAPSAACCFDFSVSLREMLETAVKEP